MAYSVSTISAAEKELDQFPATLFVRIRRSIIALEDNPRPRGVRKLAGRDLYRLRVGDYRVLYIIDDEAQEITIAAVGHRREIYR